MPVCEISSLEKSDAYVASTQQTTLLPLRNRLRFLEVGIDAMARCVCLSVRPSVPQQAESAREWLGAEWPNLL